MELDTSILVSYASKGREDYNKGLLRLIDSVKEHWTGHAHFRSLDGNVNSHNGYPIVIGELPNPEAFINYQHSVIPYFFKFVIIQLMRERGYEKIIWLDSSMVLEKDPLPLLENGIMAFHNLGHPLYKYISDQCASNLQCEDILHSIYQTWGGAIGFDFSIPWVNELFDEIITQAIMGSFNEGKSSRQGFVAHRHDQSVLSVLLHKYKVPLIPYGKIVTHPHYLPPFEWGNDYYISHRPIV